MSTAPETPGAEEGAGDLGAGRTTDVRQVEVLARATWESEGRRAADWHTAGAEERQIYRRMARTVLVWAEIDREDTEEL